MLRVAALLSLAVFMLLSVTLAAAQDASPDARKPIHSEADLPQHRYALSTPTVSELLDGGPAFDALAAQVKRNTEATLRDYAIDDPATLRGLYGTLIDLAVLQGDAASLKEHCARYIPLLQRPAARLLGCTRSHALLARPQSPTSDAASTVEQTLYRQLAELPWDSVGDDVKQARADTAMPGQRAMLLGMLQQAVDPAYQARGTIDDATARNMLSARINLGLAVPLRDALLAGYDRYIQQHVAQRRDIWDERGVTLSASERLHPVTIAVWDQGTDLSHFVDRRWTNPKEQDNGLDDDGNGFIDDLHGIGFDARQQQTTDLLGVYDDDQGTDEADIRALAIGRADLQAGLATDSARSFAMRVDAMTPEQAGALQQAGAAYGFHVHGTAVADVAMRGNPAARLLVVRSSNDLWRVPPPVPTLQQMTRDGDKARRIIDYLKAQQVRVVNISWGATPGDYQGLLEANGVTGSAEQLRAQAKQLFDAWGTPLAEAIRNAPDVLFVVAAGNAGNDVDFSGGLPESLVLPNVLVVGAVDRSGEVSGFSSSGTHVRVYANGEQVRVLLPGANAGTFLTDGTSIAAPAVTALAGQLFALDPSLNPAQVVDLIVRGATPGNDDKQRMIHPKASIALLREQRRKSER